MSPPSATSPTASRPTARGRSSPSDAQPNFDVHCAAPPTDPNTPNVRGFQNLKGSSSNRVAPTWGLALMNPDSGVVVTPDGLPLQLTNKTDARCPTTAVPTSAG